MEALTLADASEHGQDSNLGFFRYRSKMASEVEQGKARIAGVGFAAAWFGNLKLQGLSKSEASA